MDTRALIPIDDYLAQIETARDYLVSRLGSFVPRVLVICGSGLGGLADILENPISIAYNEIPNFPQTTVAGHAGRLVFGNRHGKAIVCMVGRLHAYEGYSSQKLTFPVRVMKALGAEILLVTNASGGLNKAFRAGDIMIIKDHISLPGLAGQSPLMGPNDERLGPRFTPMTDPYDRELLKLAKRTAVENKHDFVRVGVYAHVAGPAYETRSEAKFLVMLGGDAVGMSTVPEVVVARHAGMRVLGLSLITNLVAKEEEDDFITNHEEVLSTSKARSKTFQEYVHQIIAKME